MLVLQDVGRTGTQFAPPRNRKVTPRLNAVLAPNVFQRVLLESVADVVRVEQPRVVDEQVRLIQLEMLSIVWVTLSNGVHRKRAGENEILNHQICSDTVQSMGNVSITATDGAGLVTGVLEHLLNRSEPPRVLAATHFHEIFEAGFLQPRPSLAFAHMEIMINQEAALDQQITYLYTLRPGRSIQSFGTCCAAMNGIAKEVVQRAENLILLSARCGDLVEACAEMPEDELAELQAAVSLTLAGKSCVFAKPSQEDTARKFLSIATLTGGRAMLQGLL